jgi:aromatic-L-amino-acid decarboxylase
LPYAHRFGCWFHVDAAYGGFFYLLDEMKEKLAGISEADSLVVDPHKAQSTVRQDGSKMGQNLDAVIKALPKPF